jgi:hypothetical protein
MYFLATGKVQFPERMAALQDAETAALNALRTEGTVLDAFLLPGCGVISFVSGESAAAVDARMASLPFVSEGLLHFEYEQVFEL